MRVEAIGKTSLKLTIVLCVSKIERGQCAAERKGRPETDQKFGKNDACLSQRRDISGLSTDGRGGPSILSLARPESASLQDEKVVKIYLARGNVGGGHQASPVLVVILVILSERISNE